MFLLRKVLFLFLYLYTCDGALSKLRCHLRPILHKAVQTDLTGRKCWDEVKIYTCRGHCLSYEIPDWQFPYKESHHPVCVHGERRISTTKLRFCDRGVQPGTELYQYVEADSCKCQVCSSEDTSCEWLPPNTTALTDLFMKNSVEEEFDIDK